MMEDLLHQEQQTKGNINHIQNKSLLMNDTFIYSYENKLNRLNTSNE